MTYNATVDPFPAIPLGEEGLTSCQFLDPLHFKFWRTPLTPGAGNWQLTRDFRFTFRIPGSRSLRTLTAPRGMCTDLASVPKLLWPIVGPYGDHLGASIIHDYLFMAWTDFYQKPERWMLEYANRVMYAGMEIDQVDDDTQRRIYNAVNSVIGWLIFKHKAYTFTERMREWEGRLNG